MAHLSPVALEVIIPPVVVDHLSVILATCHANCTMKMEGHAALEMGSDAANCRACVRLGVKCLKIHIDVNPTLMIVLSNELMKLSMR